MPADVDFRYILKTPSCGPETKLLLYFEQYLLIKRNWVDTVIFTKTIMECRGHRTDLDIYPRETVSVNTSKSSTNLSKIRYSREYMLYLTHFNSFRSKTEFTLFIVTNSSFEFIDLRQWASGKK